MITFDRHGKVFNNSKEVVGFVRAVRYERIAGQHEVHYIVKLDSQLLNVSPFMLTKKDEAEAIIVADSPLVSVERNIKI